jgi:F420-dependent oxidoreductase-like protein
VEIALMIEGQENVTWEQWLALAAACEEHGFDGLFRSDHYLSFGHAEEWGNLDAWTTLAALAVGTSRIRLGTLVSPVGFRHPSNLAKCVVTVDHVSGGRAEVGLGAGWFEAEHTAFGFAFPTVRERMDALEEQVAIVHRLLSHDQDEVSFEGAHYRIGPVHPLFRPVQRPHPPLIIGGDAGPRSVVLAARWADEYNSVAQTAEWFVQTRGKLDSACETIGRDPAELRLSLMTTTLVGEDQDDVHAKVARLMERRGDSGDPAAFIERLGEERLFGTPERLLERLADYARAGVKRVMLQHLFHEDLESLALIGRDVIPEAAGL